MSLWVSARFLYSFQLFSFIPMNQSNCTEVEVVAEISLLRSPGLVIEGAWINAKYLRKGWEQ